MGDNLATERKSTLAVKLETATVTGTLASTGTAVTGTTTVFQTELTVGSVIGNDTSGWRTVVAIATNTALTVDSAFAVALSAATVKKQSFGVDPTIAATDVIERVDFTFEPDNPEIARDVISNTFDENEPVMGSETVAGNIVVELHGSGTAGVASEIDPIWNCAIGEKSVNVAAATHGATPCTTTSLVLVTADGAKFRKGQHILIDVSSGGTGTYEVSRITNIVTDTLTISPALSLVPPVARAIGAGVHYAPTKTELHSLWAQYWRGDITLEKYKGNKVASLALDYTAGQTVKPTFAFQGKETAVPTAGSYGFADPQYDTGIVHVARYMAVKIGGVFISVNHVAINHANELYRRLTLNSAGTQSIIRTKRTVTGSFSLLYEDAAIETAFRDGTTAELIVVSSAGNVQLTPGNVTVVSLPKIKYTKVPKSKDAGMYKYDVTFRAAKTAGEDSIFVSML